uniref:Uncharacterized protein n=1 Tax=Brassica campestris TaxID=3711 RepID=M4EUA5_BRACM
MEEACVQAYMRATTLPAASTHLLRSRMIAESVPFSSDKDASESSTSAVENDVSYDLMSHINYLRVQGVVRVSMVLVRDIWVFEKSLFHTRA